MSQAEYDNGNHPQVETDVLTDQQPEHRVERLRLSSAIDQRDIAQWTASCVSDFLRLLDHLKSCENERIDVRPNSWIDLLGRFRVWAANNGAHVDCHRSLDFRLRDASHLKLEIVGILETIHGLVREVIEYLKPDQSGSDLDGSSSSGSEESATGNTPVDRLFFSNLTIQIDCLFEMSLAIRKPARLDRFIGAEMSNAQIYSAYDMQHVTHKFSHADAVLQERLASALTFRRGILKHYNEVHEQYNKDIHNLSSQAERSEGPASSRVGTSAFQPSSLQDDHARRNVLEDQSMGTRSDRSISVQQEVDTHHSLHISSPAEVYEGKPYECPYCHYLLDIYDPKAYVRHVLEDITPYQCLVLDCPMGKKLLASKATWLAHLHEDHPSFLETWQTEPCFLCGSWPSQIVDFGKHLAHHLEEIAMFAVPNLSGEVVSEALLSMHSNALREQEIAASDNAFQMAREKRTWNQLPGFVSNLSAINRMAAKKGSPIVQPASISSTAAGRGHTEDFRISLQTPSGRGNEAENVSITRGQAISAQTNSTQGGLWTEIPKHLVIKEAMSQMGYELKKRTNATILWSI